MKIPIKMKSQFAVCINEDIDCYLSNVKCINLYVENYCIKALVQIKNYCVSNTERVFDMSNENLVIRYKTMVADSYLQKDVFAINVRFEDLKFI